VEVVGGLERELVVELRPQALAASGVSVGQVVQALQTQNLAAPVGRLEGSLDERTIRLRGRLDTPADFAQLVVSQQGGRIVRLGEVAAVRDGTEEQRTLALFNGAEAVGINITKAQGYSTTAVSEKVLERVRRSRARGPSPRGWSSGWCRTPASGWRARSPTSRRR
jgi:multidrug efflux pump subunit AcrB